MAASEKSEFPRFLDGNVFIMVSTTQTYRLHQQVLESHSTFFRKEIARYPGAHLNAAAKRNNAPQFHFEWLEDASDDDNGRFVRLEVSNSGRTIGSNPRGPHLINGIVDKSYNRAWDWVFGLFYSCAPVYDGDSLEVVLANVISMVECAEMIGSEKFVYQTADLALLRQDGILWTSILGNPAVWVELGCRLHSPSIFTEAAIHLVGKWETIPLSQKEGIPKSARLVIERKARELSIIKEAIELRILGHYPAFTTRRAADKPGRPSYSGDIYMWMCIAFFRQWVAQCISDDRTRRAPDGGLKFYTALAEGGQAYLSHLDFQEFHRYFPMSIKACHVLEANMGVLKQDIMPFVEPLIEQQSHLKRGAYDIRWLTCAKIEKEDLPWYDPNEGKHDHLKELYATIEQENAQRAAAEAADAAFGHGVENERGAEFEVEEHREPVENHAARAARARAGKKRARSQGRAGEETHDAAEASMEVSRAAAVTNAPVTTPVEVAATGPVPVVPAFEVAANPVESVSADDVVFTNVQADASEAVDTAPPDTAYSMADNGDAVEEEEGEGDGDGDQTVEGQY